MFFWGVFVFLCFREKAKPNVPKSKIQNQKSKITIRKSLIFPNIHTANAINMLLLRRFSAGYCPNKVLFNFIYLIKSIL